MKKIIALVLIFTNVSFGYASYVCYPAMGGAGAWDCFGSNGTCSGTFGECNCVGCDGSGGSSGCNTCCCRATMVFHALNCSECILSEDTEHHLILTLPNEQVKDLGNISQLNLGSNGVYQYGVDLEKKMVIFYLYNGTKLLNQVKESGHITDKESTSLGKVTLSYS